MYRLYACCNTLPSFPVRPLMNTSLIPGGYLVQRRISLDGTTGSRRDDGKPPQGRVGIHYNTFRLQ